MVRNELHVAVPSYFQCPISMEVMRSPVSLCTGITYDRSSIQKWLDAGNATCPATRQPLRTTEFVPNLSLHRLILLWSSQSLSSPTSPSSSNSPASHRRLSHLLNRISKSTFSSRELPIALSNVYDLAEDSYKSRRLLAESEGFVASIVGLLSERDPGIGVLESVLMILDLILRESATSSEQVHRLLFKSDSRKCLPAIASVLRSGRSESKIAAAKVLESVAFDVESKRAIAETRELIQELYNLLANSDDSTTEASLSTLITLAEARPSLKPELVQFGAVRVLANILFGSERKSGPEAVERVMEMLEALSTCAEGRSAICDDDDCVREIVGRMMKISAKATAHGVAVLWNVCCRRRSSKASAAAAAANGLAKILLAMQSGCAPVVKEMCRDLVKVLRSVSDMGLASYDSKATHIVPC